MLSTKQQILILLAQPLDGWGLPWKDPTLRDLQRGLKEHFRNDVTIRHIRRVLRELTHEGIIERDFNAWHFGRYGNQAQATRYRLVDFTRGFQNGLSLGGSFKHSLLREKRQTGQRDLATKGLKIGP